jgi:hypothetical protein
VRSGPSAPDPDPVRQGREHMFVRDDWVRGRPSSALPGGISGDAVILMADGRTRLLRHLREGDRVYGTRAGERHGALRSYVPTKITGIRSDAQIAYRLRFADKTVIEAGGDQLFLTYRGWKHVTGAEQGRLRRPHLTAGSVARGIGRFQRGPEDTDAYRHGYLTGLIRGDGHLATYVCGGDKKPPWVKYGFRLALADVEALDRAETYLVDAGISVRRFLFQAARPGYRPIWALGNQSRAGVIRIQRMIRWPASPTNRWRAGFLAGIFDAEGSCAARESLRICNTDPEILEWTETSLLRFEFEVVRELTDRPNAVTYMRIRGGLREKLRFFHLTDPAISRKRAIGGLALQRAKLCLVSIDFVDQKARLLHVETASGDIVANGVVAGAVKPIGGSDAAGSRK